MTERKTGSFEDFKAYTLAVVRGERIVDPNDWPIEAPDPIEAIRFMMEPKGLTRRDLEPAIGARNRVAEILNRKRPLTLPMIRRLSALLELPADILVQPCETHRAA
jgi:HTH-type transcriptional regulator/antitoxin HigA